MIKYKGQTYEFKSELVDVIAEEVAEDIADPEGNEIYKKVFCEQMMDSYSSVIPVKRIADAICRGMATNIAEDIMGENE